MRPNIGYVAASTFYLIYSVSICHFAIFPVSNGVSVGAAMVDGLLLGITTYSAYNLTNLAIVKGWSLSVSCLDIVWGAFATAITAGVMVAAIGQFSWL